MLAKTQTVDHRRELRLRVCLLLMFISLGIACALASRMAYGADASRAQLTGDYVSFPMGPYENAAKVRELETATRMCWVDGSITENSDQFKSFTEYYKSYIPRKFAQPDAGAELNDIVYATLRGLESTARSGSATMKQRAQVTVRDTMKAIATQPIQGKYFHPAARINATLLLANLNASAPEGGAPPRPDVSNEVAGTLFNIYRTAEIPTGVRLVALGGMRRHAMLMGQNTPGTYKTALLGQGKALLEGNGPDGLKAADLPADAYAFIQRYAVDIVAAVGSPEDKKWLLNQLQTIVKDEKSSPIIADAAARRLGAMTTELKETPLDSQALVAWAERTHRALTTEAERLKALTPPPVVLPQMIYIKNQQGGMGDMGGYGGMGMAGSGMGGAGSSGYDDGMGNYGGEGDGNDGLVGGMGPGAGAMGGPGGGAMGGPGDMGGYGGYGGMGGMSSVKQEPVIVASRRVVNAHLESQLVGLSGGVDVLKPTGGILMVATDDAKKLADELAASLATAVEEVNNKTVGTRQRYILMLEEQAKGLKKWIDRNKVVPKGKPAETNDGKPGGGEVAGGGESSSGQAGG